MLHRVLSGKFVTALALGAALGFAAGCGDNNNNNNQDAAAQDRPQTDVSQQDVAQQDTAQQDTGGQQDAANPPGTVLAIQASPQLTGNPAFDQQLAGLQFSYVVASWDPVDPDDGADIPVAYVDHRNSMGIGCYAKYYKKGQKLDSGLVSDYRPTTANAGEVSITGYTGGAFIVGFDHDAGAPITTPFPSTVHCKRFEIMGITDAGVPTDAGTGLYEYQCDNYVGGYGGATAPVTGFLRTTDKLTVSATGGGYEVGAFEATNVQVAPFIKVIPEGSLWNLPLLQQAATDAGIPLTYYCPDAGSGESCSNALAIQITWGDVDTPPNFFGTPPWNVERGKIQCSAFGAGKAYFIPNDVWNTAFPPGANWRTIQAFVTHVVPQIGKPTIVGGGGGQFGVTHHP